MFSDLRHNVVETCFFKGDKNNYGGKDAGNGFVMGSKKTVVAVAKIAARRTRGKETD